MRKNRKISILGGGESGIGAAVLARQQGFDVFVSDNSGIGEIYKQELIARKIAFEENGHTLDILLEAGEIIKSPGIPDHAPVIQKLTEAGIPIISEIEFASRFTQAKLICITGSNGKTTTTLLIFYLLKNAGLHVGLAGNIGQSFARQVAEHDYDVFVLEISSFQLDGMFKFKADIAVITNITPDHLDRYAYQFERYVNSKMRILQNQTPHDAVIYCADDPVLAREMSLRPLVAQRFPYSLTQHPVINGAYLENDKIKIVHLNNQFTMTLEQLALQGKHNIHNSMAAGIAAKLMDVRKESLKQSLSDFQNIAHRLEFVSSVHGISFINDSKATNVNSTWYALEYVDKPTVWIAGGVDKGNDYESLKLLVKEKVKAIVCLGLDNSRIHEAFGELVPDIINTESAEDAVIEAYQLASKGDIVLLSPACSSFDLFESYEDRGNQFKQAVNRL